MSTHPIPSDILSYALQRTSLLNVKFKGTLVFALQWERYTSTKTRDWPAKG